MLISMIVCTPSRLPMRGLPELEIGSDPCRFTSFSRNPAHCHVFSTSPRTWNPPFITNTPGNHLRAI